MRPFRAFIQVLTALMAAPVPPAFASPAKKCVIALSSSESQSALPFEILANNPVDRVKRAASQALSEARAVEQADSKTTKETPHAPELQAAIHQRTNAALRLIKAHALRIRKLLVQIDQMSTRLEGEVASRLTALDSFLANLPTDIADYKIQGPDAFLNSRPLSVVKLYAQEKALQQQFSELLKNHIKTNELIRALRSNSNIMNSKEIQTLLQEHVTDGIEHSVQQVVHLYNDPLGRNPDRPPYLGGLFTFTLPGWYGVQNNYDKRSDEVTIQANWDLLVQLTTELVNNATNASRQRHPQVPNPNINWGLFYARTRVKQDPSGDVRIEIEDFGYPEEYTNVRGVGNSHAIQSGTGIGRFRAYVLAGFMGYRITHEAKPDGSGSIVTIHVPASHVLSE